MVVLIYTPFMHKYIVKVMHRQGNIVASYESDGRLKIASEAVKENKVR